MKNAIKIFLMLFVVLALPLSASAAHFESSDQITINQAMTEDVYIAGGMVTISESINGDLFVAGGNVNISNNITQDVFAAGSQVIITGDVADDLRVAGSNVMLSGSIGDDLFAAGSMVHITSDVYGDVHVAGAAVIIDGTIHGDILVGSGSLIINGHVLGNIAAYSDEIVVGSGAKINGVLKYYSDHEMDFDETNIGAVIYQQYAGSSNVDIDVDIDGFKRFASGVGSIGLIIKLLGLLIVGMIIGLVWPKTGSVIAERSIKKFWMNILTGLVTVIVVPIATLILLISTVGWPIALSLIPAAFLLSIITMVYIGIVVGNLITKLIQKKKVVEITWYGILLGVVIMFIISLIPILGWLAVCIIYLTVLGSILRLLYDQVRKMN